MKIADAVGRHTDPARVDAAVPVLAQPGLGRVATQQASNLAFARAFTRAKHVMLVCQRQQGCMGRGRTSGRPGRGRSLVVRATVRARAGVVLIRPTASRLLLLRRTFRPLRGAKSRPRAAARSTGRRCVSPAPLRVRNRRQRRVQRQRVAPRFALPHFRDRLGYQLVGCALAHARDGKVRPRRFVAHATPWTDVQGCRQRLL